MIDEERLRDRLQRAIGYEAPSAGFGMQSLSHSEATTNARSKQRQPRSAVLGLVAAVIAFAIVISLVLAGQALRSRSNVPVHSGPAPWAAPNPIRTEICTSQCQVATQPPFQPKPAAIRECASGCATQTPLFTTGQLGWITDSFEGPDGPAYLYRTDDAGQHWRPLLNWNGPGAQLIRASVDGSEALIVTAWNSEGAATAFHTTDSGAHWTAQGLPSGIDSDLVYFLNPREGWILQSANLDLVHTTDSGIHWTRIARLDGIVRGGVLGFLTPVDGFYLLGGSVYWTHDGGATWGVQAPPRPSGVPASAYVAHSTVKFFNSHDGVLELEYCTVALCPSPRYYAYATSDGGSGWTTPLRLPATQGSGNIFIFIDSDHWIATSGGMFGAHTVIHTADAGQHWTVLYSAANSNMAQGQWDMIEYPTFIDPLHGWALSPISGANSLLVTSDGGITWATAPLPS